MTDTLLEATTNPCQSTDASLSTAPKANKKVKINRIKLSETPKALPETKLCERLQLIDDDQQPLRIGFGSENIEVPKLCKKLLRRRSIS
ncbi:unnamed protein product [Soboliphyme baturini]|uniref:Uncharacterized protein n=1 Tax=Soboliphyme baturini TaxID=241478 RepID=A0A183J2D4_9BILA|nr:unnamed protein product [Soboliphyme baturini]